MRGALAPLCVSREENQQVITQEYIDSIYERLSAMDMELDADPIQFGPSRLNTKTAELRAFLSSTEKIFMEVSHNLQQYKRNLLVCQTQYKLEVTNLMANDPHVRSGRSQTEREALAATRLVPLQVSINDHTLAVHDLEDLLSVIKAKRLDLKDIQGRLKDQLKLCQEQLALGQRWGVKTYTPKDFGITEDLKLPSIVSNPSVTTDTLVKDYLNEREEAENSEDELAKALAAPPKSVLLDNISDTSAIEEFSKMPLDQVETSNIDELDLDDLFSEFGGD